MKLFQSLRYHPLSLLSNFSNISFQTYYGLSPSKQRANLIFLWRSWQGSWYLMLSLHPHKKQTFRKIFWKILKYLMKVILFVTTTFNTNDASLELFFDLTYVSTPPTFWNYDYNQCHLWTLNLVSAKTILTIPHKKHVR